jgi:hypothetical protein
VEVVMPWVVVVEMASQWVVEEGRAWEVVVVVMTQWLCQ